MKSKIVILTLVGLTAGVFGTVGSRVLAEDPPAAAVPEMPQVNMRGNAVGTVSGDACRGLARKLSHGSMSDAQLKRLLKKHRDCRAVVIDSKAPMSGSSTGTRIVTIPASTEGLTGTVPPPVASQTAPSDDEASYEDEDEDEHEEDGDEEDEYEEDD